MLYAAITSSKQTPHTTCTVALLLQHQLGSFPLFDQPHLAAPSDACGCKRPQASPRALHPAAALSAADPAAHLCGCPELYYPPAAAQRAPHSKHNTTSYGYGGRCASQSDTAALVGWG
jgi:hypothetical protein